MFEKVVDLHTIDRHHTKKKRSNKLFYSCCHSNWFRAPSWIDVVTLVIYVSHAAAGASNNTTPTRRNLDKHKYIYFQFESQLFGPRKWNVCRWDWWLYRQTDCALFKFWMWFSVRFGWKSVFYFMWLEFLFQEKRLKNVEEFLWAFLNVMNHQFIAFNNLWSTITKLI